MSTYKVYVICIDLCKSRLLLEVASQSCTLASFYVCSIAQRAARVMWSISDSCKVANQDRPWSSLWLLCPLLHSH